MKIIYDEKCLNYESRGHPESPQRIKISYNFLKDKKYIFQEPFDYKEDIISLAHSKELIKKVKEEKFFDPDTPNLKNIYYYAFLSVKGALTAYEIAKKERFCFSLIRPPGHHAGKNFLGGFCYFNNIAIACKKALKEGFKKIAILDIDAHHGNGTQDIFLGEKNILYVSLHQSPLYPGTGLTSEKNCINFPLLPECNDELYLEKLELALNKIKKFCPQILAISCGFDTYKGDYLTNFMLSVSCYKLIGEKIKENFKDLIIFSVLEGGYSKNIGILIDNFLEGIKLS
jgi:acetoin utilization deacetylase AcuC-like enzyme